MRPSAGSRTSPVGHVDAIVGYWDFPVSSLVPMLCRRRGLPSPPLESVVKCEHKYWSRLEQQKVISEHPAFGVIDLDQPDELPDGVAFPVWVKPVKSASSELAFHVQNQDELATAMAEIRAGAGKMGEPFEFVLDQVELPDEIASVGGTAALVEESVSGAQLTVEGYAHDGEVRVHGIIDSLTYPDSPSFRSYHYPSSLPQPVQDRLVDNSTRVIRQIGLSPSAFNIEYFWDAETDRLALLEVNPRLSQSHAWLFEQVDGVANHQVMVRLALGQPPGLPRREGAYGVAAKYFLRRFDDGVVTTAPPPELLERVEREVDGVQVHPVATEGSRLSAQRQQDSYSFEVAQTHVAAADREELEEKYLRCVQMLGYEIDGDPLTG
ncbi:MAG TPA: ATP-grasp domain-containing protein [Nocardioidaceae bacterium]|nr:ATP-grasp domain-containing protein [Nocardioidaceae bacterium]